MKLVGHYPEQALETAALMTPSTQPYARGLVPWSPRWHIAKISLRTAILAISALTWIMFNFTSNPWIFIAVPIMIADIIWQLAEFAVLARFSKTKKRGIHPIAHLVWDLLFWMGFFIVAFLFSAVVLPEFIPAVGQDDQLIQSGSIACAVFLFFLWYVPIAHEIIITKLTVPGIPGLFTSCSSFAIASKFINAESRSLPVKCCTTYQDRAVHLSRSIMRTKLRPWSTCPSLHTLP